MTKKISLLFIFYFLLSSLLISKADDSADTSKIWGNDTSSIQKGFENQEAVTDTKLHKTIKQLKERSLSKKQQKIRNEVQPLSPASDLEHFQNFVQANDPDDALSQTLTVMIPVKAYSSTGKTINPGYYKLSCHKVAEQEYELELSQGTIKILRTKAFQTNQDLKQESISFCNAEIISGNRIRLMFGTIDLNLVGYLYF